MFKILLGLLLSFPAVATQLEMLALDEATPQIVVPQAGDSYLAPVTLQAATGNEIALELDYTVNKASSGNDTGLLINMTDTASPGTSLLIDAQVGGVSKFNVDNAGNITWGSANGIIANPASFFLRAGANEWTFASTDASMRIPGELRLSTTSAPIDWAQDLYIYRDAANTLAQRNGANAQITNIYGDYGGATDYQRTAIKTVSAGQTVPSAASATISGIVPAGAMLIGVTTRIDVALGETNGTTGYAVGDGVDANLWGDVSGVAIGTSSDSSDFTASGAVGFDTAARDVVLTAAGGNFDGTGTITVVVHYMITEAD